LPAFPSIHAQELRGPRVALLVQAPREPVARRGSERRVLARLEHGAVLDRGLVGSLRGREALGQLEPRFHRVRALRVTADEALEPRSALGGRVELREAESRFLSVRAAAEALGVVGVDATRAVGVARGLERAAGHEVGFLGLGGIAGLLGELRE
jgi:hypothetical protein